MNLTDEKLTEYTPSIVLLNVYTEYTLSLRYNAYPLSIVLLAVVGSVKASDMLIDGAILSLPQQ